jgi:fumarate reductase subunit C
MAPARAGSTRTAPPSVSDRFWSAPRMRRYLIFDATGITYLLVGLSILRVTWALGSGPEAWQNVLGQFRSPAYLGFHLLVLLSVILVGVRFFGLFPKAQPPKIGAVAPPPGPLIYATLYAAWGALTLGLVLVLGGFLP